MSALPIPKMTEEEFLAFEQASDVRHEFFHGEVFAMAGGNASHSQLKVRISSMLDAGLRKRECRVADSDMMVTVRPTGLKTYPDISVVCGRPKFQDLRELELLNPILIVEILSDATAAYDRGKKFWHYRQIESLEEYMLVSTDEPLVEVYQRRADGAWTLRAYDGLSAAARLDSLDLSLPLSEIYAKTVISGETGQETE
jgi:Uma2 family endonuclease